MAAAATGKAAQDKGQVPAARFDQGQFRDAATMEEAGSGKESREELHDRLTVPPHRPGQQERVNAPGEDLRPPAVRAADEGLGPRTREQIFAVMDAQEWACRSQDHRWAQLVPGAKELPEGMRVSAAGAGNVMFEWDCLNGCGRYRKELCQNGYIVVSRTYGTRPGHRHTVIHRDETMTKTTMREGVYAGSSKMLDKAVRADTAARRAEARAAAKAAKTGAAT